MSVFSVVRGQSDNTLLENINFNDTSLIDTEALKTVIAEYIDSSLDRTKTAKEQMYDMILATDNVLAHASTGFEMYRFVYQYLIGGFSTLGANMVVDYMVRLPYFEFVEADEIQRLEMQNIAESYKRVKIGAEAPVIQAVTLEGKAFDLTDVESEYVLVFFWSPSCPHCHEMLKELAKYANKREGITVVTVSVGTDLKEVRKMLAKSRLKGYHICDGDGWNSLLVDDYAVDVTPSLFLLKDKRILAKPFDIKELITIIE